MAKLRIKKHPIYHWLYAFTDGRVYSTKSHKFVGNIQKQTGYLQVTVSKDKTIGIHRIIADCFIPKPESDEELVPNHKNRIRNDNRVENLEWLTHKQNMNYPPTLEAISKIQKTVKNIPEIRKKMSETAKIIMNRPEVKEKCIKSHKFQSKSIQCIETNQIFGSINDAARKMNLSRGNLTTHLNHPENLHSIKGYHFKFIEN